MILTAIKRAPTWVWKATKSVLGVLALILAIVVGVLALIVVGLLACVWRVMKWVWRLGEPPWWVEGVVVAALIAAIVVFTQARIDDQRSVREQERTEEQIAREQKRTEDQIAREQERAAVQTALSERLENVRFVRERSSAMYQERPFQHLDLRGMSLNALRLNGADFSEADLRGARMNFIQLSVVTPETIPPGTSPPGGLTPSSSDMLPPEWYEPMVSEGYWLMGTPTASNLLGARLCGAELGAADLRGANLGYANLSDVDLRETHLNFSVLLHADLRTAKLDARMLRYSVWDESTLWPPDFDPPPPYQESLTSQNDKMGFGMFLDLYPKVMKFLGVDDVPDCN